VRVADREGELVAIAAATADGGSWLLARVWGTGSRGGEAP